MKHLPKICAIMMIVILAASLAYTAHELCVTRAKLVAAELTARMVSEMAEDNVSRLEDELDKATAETVVHKKWVPEWRSEPILKYEPEQPAEVR